METDLIILRTTWRFGFVPNLQAFALAIFTAPGVAAAKENSVRVRGQKVRLPRDPEWQDTVIRPRLAPNYQAERLREAARQLNEDVAPNEGVRKRISGVLREAAERIERSGTVLGQPVSYALQIAGGILSEDLGHNR